MWYVPIVASLRARGGSALKKYVYEDIIKNENVEKTYVEYPLYPKGNVFENQVDWARNDLKDAGIIVKPSEEKLPDGVWKLTEEGMNHDIEDRKAFEQFVFAEKRRSPNRGNGTGKPGNDDEEVRQTHYWMYYPEKDWKELLDENKMVIEWTNLGDLNQYDKKESIREKMQELNGSNDKFRNPTVITWEFANEMEQGDVVYAKKDKETILARGIVKSEYKFDDEHFRTVEWKENIQKNPVQRSTRQMMLTDITDYMEDVKLLENLFQEEIAEITDSAPEEKKYKEYTEEKFLEAVYMDEKEYHKLVKLLRMKKNVILQGAPGVGKTFAAKRLAYSMMGEENPDRIEMVQFHQSYSYEDFVVGYRPTETGFKQAFGTFYNFCKKVHEDNADRDVEDYRDYFFIIDEINRGNLSKIFGELFMLIEHDKRDKELSLLYVNEKFSIPQNVYIIGMMNTADRSLAMMDYALRRRFAFYEFGPAFESDQFKKYQKQVNHAKFDALIGCVKALNDAIEQDPALGRGFRVGHSYFCVPEDKIHMIDDEWIENVIDYELIPLLEEYWFDEPKKVAEWTDLLNACKKEAK
ncbi:MAG: AAA family ATPase [Firmicutes bacterium]|nr:AAA family ATPase [Bacillota bacterium]